MGAGVGRWLGRTTTITNAAVMALGSLLSARALALAADDVLGVGELGRLALVQLL